MYCVRLDRYGMKHHRKFGFNSIIYASASYMIDYWFLDSGVTGRKFLLTYREKSGKEKSENMEKKRRKIENERRKRYKMGRVYDVYDQF